MAKLDDLPADAIDGLNLMLCEAANETERHGLPLWLDLKSKNSPPSRDDSGPEGNSKT